MRSKLRNLRRSDVALGLLCLLTVVGLITRPGSVPPVWWDEGWALSIARNWVEFGHYGLLRDGERVSAAMLTSGFPLVAPIALSFRIFGIGLWQARVPGVFYTLGTLALLYSITRRLYDRSVATAALMITLLASPLSELHPVLIGRQALGEMPTLFFLLLGYATLLRTTQSRWWLLPTALSWGIAIITKPQVLPFLSLALLIPGLVAVRQQQWLLMGRLVTLLAGAHLTSRTIGFLLSSALYAPTVFHVTLSGHYGISAVVLRLPVRVIAVVVSLAFGVTVISGLTYAIWRAIRRRGDPGDHAVQLARLSLLSLTTSWFSWYLCLSAGWPRYLFPPFFLGSVFSAMLLRDLTGGFRKLSVRLDRATTTVPGFSLRRFACRLILFHGLAMISLTIVMIGDTYWSKADASVRDVAAFLNAETRPETRIETYDTELFFLIDRLYHYPPDQIAVLLDRRIFQGENIEITYDALQADPDYLVVGPFSRLCKIYDDVLDNGRFTFVHDFGRYTIYERVR